MSFGALFKKGAEAEKTGERLGAWGKLYEDVHIAIGKRFATKHRAEEAKAPDAQLPDFGLSTSQALNHLTATKRCSGHISRLSGPVRGAAADRKGRCCSRQIVAFRVREVGQDLVLGHAACQVVEVVVDRDSEAANARLAAALARL